MKKVCVGFVIMLAGCGGSIGGCDIAKALRQASEFGESVACAGSEISVSGAAGVGAESSEEVYTVTISEER